MAVAGVLYKLSWGGSLFVNEIWSNSIHVNGAVLSGSTAEELSVNVKDFYSDAGSGSSNQSKLEWVKWNAIDAITGKYISLGFTDIFTYPTPVVGGSVAGAPQLTLCASLTTSLARGRAHIGRIYPPNGSGPNVPDANGGVAAGVTQPLANAVATFCNGINAATTGKVSIYSKGTKLQPTGNPIAVAVTGVKVGNVIDTQRRRRNNLRETYTVSTIPVT